MIVKVQPHDYNMDLIWKGGDFSLIKWSLQQGSIIRDLAKDIQDLAGSTLELVEQIKALKVS